VSFRQCSRPSQQYFGDDSAHLLDRVFQGVNFTHLIAFLSVTCDFGEILILQSLALRSVNFDRLIAFLPVACDFGAILILQSLARDSRWGMTRNQSRRFSIFVRTKMKAQKRNNG
jgi:hypothetical protein